MRRELTQSKEQQQEQATNVSVSGQRDEKLEIRREFAEISPKLERIACDVPPKVARERWQMLAQEIRKKIHEEAQRKGLGLRIKTLRDCYRATDSQLLRFGIILLIVIGGLLISVAAYFLYELLRPQASPDGYAAAWCGLLGMRHALTGFVLSGHWQREAHWHAGSSRFEHPECQSDRPGAIS